MDRRIKKTRQALQQALMSLLREKPLEKIDIQEITDRANTARVTFYRHYHTREELLIDTIEQVYQSVESSFRVHTIEEILDFRCTPPVQAVFELMETDRPFYKKLFTGTISAFLQQRCRHYIVQQVTLTFNNSPRFANLPLFLIANHVASVIIGNIMWWLSDDLPYSARYMAQITHQVALTGAMTLVGRGNDLIHLPETVWRMPEMYQDS